MKAPNSDPRQTSDIRLSAKQVAARMGLTTRQLQALRLRGIGPSLMQCGLDIYYPLDEITLLEEYEAKALITQVLQLPEPLIALKHLAEQFKLKCSPVLKEIDKELAKPSSPQDCEALPKSANPIDEKTSSKTNNAPTPQSSVLKSASEIAVIGKSQAQSLGITTANQTPQDHAAWYLIHTKPRQEATALENLQRQGFECYLPKITKQILRRKQSMTQQEPMFARYLFIKLAKGENGHNWMPIRSTIGVNQLVQFGGKATAVDERIITILKSRESSEPIEPRLKAGDKVTISDGPLQGLDAIFQTSDAEHRAIILLDFLNRQMTLKINAARLRKHA